MKCIVLVMITVALFHQQQAYRRKSPSLTSIANYISPPYYYNHYPSSPYAPWRRNPFYDDRKEFDGSKRLFGYQIQEDSFEEPPPSEDDDLASALLGERDYESRFAGWNRDNLFEPVNEYARHGGKKENRLFVFYNNSGLWNIWQQTVTTTITVTTPLVQTCIPGSLFSGGRPAATCRKRREVAQILDMQHEESLAPSAPLSMEATAAPDLPRERRADRGGNLESSLNDLMRMRKVESPSNRLLFQNFWSTTTVTSYTFTASTIQKTLGSNFLTVVSSLLCIPSNVALCT